MEVIAGTRIIKPIDIKNVQKKVFPTRNDEKWETMMMMILILNHALFKSDRDFIYMYKIYFLWVADILISHLYSLLKSVVYFLEKESKYSKTAFLCKNQTYLYFLIKIGSSTLFFLFGIFKSFIIPDLTRTRKSSLSLVLLGLVHRSNR